MKTNVTERRAWKSNPTIRRLSRCTGRGYSLNLGLKPIWKKLHLVGKMNKEGVQEIAQQCVKGSGAVIAKKLKGMEIYESKVDDRGN